MRAVAVAGTAVVLILVGVALRGHRFLDGRTAAGGRADAQASAPHGPAGQPRCPERFDLGSGPPQVRRSGQLVPAGPDHGLLCTYDWRTSDVAPALAGSRPLTGNVDRLVTYLNNLSPADRASTPGTQQGHACSLISKERYQIVLGYPDQRHVTVAVYDSCGVVEQDGAVRHLRSMRELEALW